MKKLKLDKEISRRIASLSMVGIIAITSLTGCTNKKNKQTEVDMSIVTLVDDTNNKIDAILPEASDEIVNNASIMLLLDVIAKKDENGKISAEEISKLKAKIDADKMMDEFNSFLDMINFNIEQNGVVLEVSEILPEELNEDKTILSNIEIILKNIIKYSKKGNKDSLVSEFNEIYKLFVEEEEIEMDGVKFKIRDLTFPSRAVANAYAKTVAYYSKDFISKEQYEKLDERTNDQDNKAYIKSKLEILSNEIEEESETDINLLFNDSYSSFKDLYTKKVILSDDQEKGLVNYVNLDYLYSDKVSTKDRNDILGEYDEEKVSDILIAIDAINKYNLNNQKNIIPYSSLLVENYANTEGGKIDKVALDFVQYNSIKLLSTTNSETTYEELSNNPYFKNLYKYFTKQDFTHITKDDEIDIVWQEISEGVNFVNNETILYTLIQLPKVENMNLYIERTQTSLTQSIQSIQNIQMGECEKVDAKEYIKK